MSPRLLTLAFTLLVALAPIATAQSTVKPAPPLPALHEGSIEFAFVGTSGNSSTQTIGTGAEFVYRPDGWEGKLKAGYVHNRSDGDLTAESFNSLLRAGRTVHHRISTFGEYGFQRDRFAGVRNRQTIDTGVSYIVLDEAPQKLTIDGGFGYAHESRLTGRRLSTATLNSGAEYAVQVTEAGRVTEEAHLVFSPAMDEDWRYTNIAAVSAKMSTLLSLKLSNTVNYVNFPAPGFRTTDVLTSVALVAKF